MSVRKTFYTGLRVFSCLIVTATGSANAQWSSDSLLNLKICDLAGDQAIPKMVATSDGGCFVSWFDIRSGDYCLYLQRLNSQGEPQFTENGLLVSDKPQMTWLTDYDMAVDADDNAVLVFSDTRNTADELDISAYMVGSDGSFIWGADGICLSDTSVSGFEPAPKVAVTDIGNCVVVWGKSASQEIMIFQKLSPAGEKLWGDWGIAVSDAAADLSSPDVIPSGEDSMIVLWKKSTGTYPAQTTHLYTQKFSNIGTGTWGDTFMLIYDSGAISPWNTPTIQPDGNGGALYCWYDAPATAVFNSWIQHIDTEGNMLFPMNGAQASTNSSQLHMSPAATGNGDFVYAFWVEENTSQTQYGLFGQKFSSTGNRLWTDSGLELLPLGSSQITSVSPLWKADGIYIGYMTGNTETSVRVIRTDDSGAFVWGPTSLSAASLGSKGDMQMCPGYAESALFSWNDNRNDGGIYAQNINIDGSTGPFLGVGEEAVQNNQASICLSSNPCAGTVNIGFRIPETGTVSLQVFDVSGRLVKTLVNTTISHGTHSVSWNRISDSGQLAAPGLYLIRLNSGNTDVTSRFILSGSPL